MGRSDRDDVPDGLGFDAWIERGNEVGEWFLTDLVLSDWPRLLFGPSPQGVADVEPGAPEPFARATTAFFRSFPDLTAGFSHDDVDRGIWRLWMDPIWGQFVGPASATVEVDLAASMLVPFRDYVALLPERPIGNGFYMWFDLISDRMNKGAPAVRDAYLRTLSDILELDDEACQACALHGLGHLDHPERPAVVERYIHRHRDKALNLDWLHQCRDGTVM